MGQLLRRAQPLFQMLQRRAVTGDECRLMKLKRQPIRLRRVGLRGLDVAEGVGRRPFGLLRQGEVRRHAVVGKAQAALRRQLGPERGDRRVDVGAALAGQAQLGAFRLVEFCDLLRQHDL